MGASIIPDALAQLVSLWQEAERWPVSDVDGAIDRMMHRLAGMVGAPRSLVMVGARISSPQGDPLDGWRAVILQHSVVELEEEVAEDRIGRCNYLQDSYVLDTVTQFMQRQAGYHRAAACSQLPPEVLEGSRTAQLMAAVGVVDRLIVTHATFADQEVCFIFSRELGEAPFGEAEQAVARAALEGLDVLCERYVLSLGLLHGERPMAPRQRQTLLHLLTGRSEKEIAQAMEVSLATAHQYVVSVYRLFRVSSRPELMALWLDLGASCAHVPPARRRAG